MFQFYFPSFKLLLVLASEVKYPLGSYDLKVNLVLIGLKIWLYPNLLKINDTFARLLTNIFLPGFIIFKDPLF